MTDGLPQNPDLDWDLDNINNRQRAIDFVMQFETTLCVYSPSVEQLYSTYSIHFPEVSSRRLVILPDPAAFHDTFNGIVDNAIQDTGLYIIPGELIQKSGLYLANIDENRSLGSRQVPFEAGMKAITKNRPDDDPFLPVLVKGDLREFEESWPVVHLHRVKLQELTERSQLDRSSIRNVVGEKLDSLYLDQQKR